MMTTVDALSSAEEETTEANAEGERPATDAEEETAEDVLRALLSDVADTADTADPSDRATRVRAFALVAQELGFACEEAQLEDGAPIARLFVGDEAFDADVAAGTPGEYPWLAGSDEVLNGEPTGEKSATEEATGADTTGATSGATPGATDANQTQPSKSDDNALSAQATSSDLSLPSVSYMVHVQTHGDQDWRKDGSTAGTFGQSKRLEAIWIKLEGKLPASGGIRYRTHVQTYGWQDWMSDGAKAGTSGESKRLESIQIGLTGELAKRYDVYYRVHAQTYGWMGWAKNGEVAGTAGYSKRLEAIQVQLVPAGGTAPSSAGQQTASAFEGAEYVSVAAHVQRIGWQDPVDARGTAGTTGQSLRVEALRLELVGSRVPGGIEANAHVQRIGWQGWRTGTVGTSGESKRVEALQMRLTGEAAAYYDVYYRVHAQGAGWMAWAKNGEQAGTQGLSARLEAVQVRLVRSGSGQPPADGQNVSKAFVHAQSAAYRIRSNGSWQEWKSDGATAGSAAGPVVTGLRANVSGDLPGSISYAVHVSKVGWMSPVSNGAIAASGSNRVEAFTAELVGEVASLYNVWYRAYVHGYGWMDWTKNGQKAGSEGQSLGIEAIEIRLASRQAVAPGPTATPMLDKVGRIVAGLSLEQKVAQLFVVTPEALTGGGTVTGGSNALRNAIASRPVGGIIYFGANLQNPSQTNALLASTRDYSQSACGLIPFQCVDEEGGTVARIAGNPAFGIANVGDMAAIGASRDASRAQSAAHTMGSYLKQLGFNVDFAPVADIATASSGVMDRRSFGSDPNLVASMIEAQVRGFSETGVLCTAKHFPGVGAAEEDSHYDRIYTHKSEAELSSWELVPFRAAISEGVPLVMVAHINCTQFADGWNLPASLNPAVINGLLRGSLGYNGLVVTDALQMGAVSGVCGNDRQGVLAVQAGVDLILMPNDFGSAYDGLLRAVRSGEISEARIDESVRRIVSAKQTI